jgi:DNA repair exonuclease SbcCD nuclease subunit
MHIADIHFGAVSPARLLQELREGFMADLESKAANVDLVVICGDLFHKKISMNDPSGKAVIDFMNELMYVCHPNGVSVRLLYGTLTHDHSQPENFRWMENVEGYDFRIIRHVQPEEVFPGYEVLWIPEEYFEDPHAVYAEHFDRQYDGVFLHGSIDFLDFSGHLNNHSQGGRFAPVFKFRELRDISRGAVLCGHIHVRQAYEDKCYYPGSYTRWVHGEEEPKCWIDHSYNVESGESTVEFYENELAPKFVTFNLDELVGPGAELEEIHDTISAIATADATVRIIVQGRLGSEDAADVAVIREAFAAQGNVRIESKGRGPQEQQAAVDDRFAFILERQMDIPDTVARYLSLVHGSELPRDTILDAISG